MSMLKCAVMNLVIDCNQASQLPIERSKTKSHSLVLSCASLAEILLRTDPRPTLARIRSYHFIIGLDVPDVMAELTRITLEEIKSFKPFYAGRGLYQHDYEYLVEGIYKPSTDHAAWAAATKARHLQNCARLTEQSVPARNEIKKVVQEHRNQAKKNKVDAEEKPSSYMELLPYETPEMTGFVYGVVSALLMSHGCEPDRIRPIYSAMLCNQYLWRLFRSVHAYCLGRAGCWKDQKSNFRPAATADDITDILLPLYAGDGDAIVTQDRLLVRLIPLIEVGGAPVSVISASNI